MTDLISPDVAADAAELIRDAMGHALEEFADHVRGTWGAAYPHDVFPPLQAGEICDGLKTRCSAAMGRHMAQAIEKELRQWAAQKRAGQ